MDAHFMNSIKLFFQKYLIYIIMVFAGFFMLYRVVLVDFENDDAMNAIRSIGYVDMTFSDAQTTPLDWFSLYPWWANLSFHDHPFVSFLIQHIFLSVNDSIFFAKLPNLISSLLAIYSIYLIALQRKDKKAGIFAAMALVFNPLFLYISRTAYMEGVLILFILLSLYFFNLYIDNKKYWWKFGLFLGLCLSTKYTSFFLIPTFLSLILLLKKQYFKSIHLYKSFILSGILFLPSITYNIYLYKTLGYFDLQFSRLFGTASPWIVNEAISTKFNIISLWITIVKAITLPYAFLFCLSFAFLYILSKRDFFISAVSFFWITIMYTIIGGGFHHMSLFSPFLALTIGLGISGVFQKFKNLRILSFIFGGMLFIYFTVCLFYSNVLFRVGNGLFLSNAVGYNFGLSQLGYFLESNLIPMFDTDNRLDGYSRIKEKKGSLKKYIFYNDKKSNTVFLKDLIVFDDRIYWGDQLWTLKRLRFYHNIPILSTKEYVNWESNLKVERIYYIKVTENGRIESEQFQTNFSFSFEETHPLDSEPEFIKNLNGYVVFKIYTLETDE